MNKIAFRVDGGKYIGMGHIMRTLVLAKELSKTNEITYISIKNNNDDYRVGIDKVKEEGFSVLEINEGDIIEQLKVIQEMNYFNCLITDSYNVNKEYFEKTKFFFERTGYIDDVNISEFDLDFLINQNIDALDHSYVINNKNSKLLLGTKYCMLRDEFKEQNNNRSTIKDIKDVLITVGGMDNDLNTLKILNKIKYLDYNFHVVIGPAFKSDLISKLNDVAQENENVILYNQPNMCSLMKRVDFAISATGSTIYELCALQIPTIGLVIAENQKNIYKYMTEKQLMIGIDEDLELAINNLKEELEVVVRNLDLLRTIRDNQKTIVNSNGVKLIAEEINNLLNKK